jgi:hypothetical protein
MNVIDWVAVGRRMQVARLGLRLPMRGRAFLCFPEASRTGNREATASQVIGDIRYLL